MKKEQFHPIYSLLLLFLVAPFLAMLISPWIYTFLQGIAVENSFFDAPFHRVTSRVVLVIILILLRPAIRLSGLHGKADYGFPPRFDKRRLMGLGLGLGILSMLLVYLIGTLFGVYVLDIADKTTFYLFRKTLQILIGGLFIGLWEEFFFRGFILGILRKSFGVITAVLLSSFLFSIVHLMRPVDPEIVNHWNAGFQLFRHLFARAGDSFLQEAYTLFCMGLVLSTLCIWMKSVYVAIGLHTGWVWVMMFFRLFTDNQNNLVWLYGDNDWISKAWMGPILSLVTLVAVWFTRKKWKRLGITDLEH